MSAKAELTARWWTAIRPSGVDERKALEKYLAKAEKALNEQRRKQNDERVVDNCLGTLKTLPDTIARTSKECDKKENKDVITGLKQLKDLVSAEVARLEQLKDDLAAGNDAEEGEVTDDALFEKDYLYKMMKLMKSGNKELRFGFGLNTNAPEDSVLLLKRKGKPEVLFKTLKKTKKFSNRLLTYGYAMPDAEDAQTLVFRLESGANEPPRILKLGRKFLRGDKRLRFRKLKVVLPSGQTLHDNEPDEEVADVADNPSQRITPEQKAQARQEIDRIEQELRKLASELNINI